MLRHDGIPLRRIQPTIADRYLIERIDRQSFHVPLHRIGSDHGAEEVIVTARRWAGKVLDYSSET